MGLEERILLDGEFLPGDLSYWFSILSDWGEKAKEWL